MTCDITVHFVGGVDQVAVRFLGHKNSSETLDTHGQFMPGDDDRLRSEIDVALRGNVHDMCLKPTAGAVI